jgi:hypothetical protein
VGGSEEFIGLRALFMPFFILVFMQGLENRVGVFTILKAQIGINHRFMEESHLNFKPFFLGKSPSPIRRT